MLNNLDIIIPVKNEAENVAELARRIHAAMADSNIIYHMIFVDDYSTDETANRVLSLTNKYPITLHKKQGKPGKAYAILEGAKLGKANYVAMIDGDLQYPPEALPKLFEIAKQKGVAVANRISHKTSILRKFSSKINSFVFGKMLMGLNCDAQSGLKVFHREIIEQIDAGDVKPWAIDVPLLKTALELGYEIGQTDIEFKDRVNGRSKVNFVKTTAEIVATSVKHRLKRRKVYTTHPLGQDHSLPVGAGIAYKKRRFTTHTNLPHKHSALITFTLWQKAVGFLILSFLALGIAVYPLATAIAFIAVLTAIYFADTLFSFYVLMKSLHFPPEISPTLSEIEGLDDKDLPIYTILCPLYKEGRVLPHFLKSISTLDWPKNKLEVLLLLEEDDKDTQSASKALDLPSYVKVLVVPDSQPKTKPKACNYGLAHATGEYVVVYDAEDKPDPLQLKKAYIAFQSLGPKVACLQGKLNYYNPNHNLLTRLFTAEYSLWFDLILPGLQSIDTYIPLGGTSNHFKTEILKSLHAWDPFNVTEDCDLGVRLFKEGYKTAIIDSVTLEEANSNPKNWIRQRSRWIKGYFQTYLVHMRNPIALIRANGIHALTFQLVIGMRISFMIINPFLWITTIVYFTARQVAGPTIEALFPSFIFYFAVFCLIFGNFMYIFNYMIGAAKCGHWGIIKFVGFIPFYWVMASIAAIMALYQLIVKPHYWEKTNHGLHLSAPQEAPEKSITVYSAGPGYAQNFRKLLQDGRLSGSFLVFSSMSANAMNFLYNAYLGRNVDLAEFGTVSLIGSIFSITSVFTGSFGKTVVYKTAYLLGKFKHPTDDFLIKVEKWGWMLSLTLTLFWLSFTPLMAIYFNADILPFLLFAPALSISAISSVYSGYLWGVMNFGVVAILVFVEALTKLIFSIGLVELGLENLVYAAIPISSIVAFIISMIFVKRIKKVSVGISEANDFAFGYFGASVLSKISSIMFLSLDVILAKHYLSPEDAGKYALLSLVGKIVYFLGTLFTQFIIPLVSAKEGEGKESENVFYELLAVSSLASVFGLVVVGLFGNYTIPILFGGNAKDISQYSLIYGYAMVCFTISGSIISYHQVKGHYAFPALGTLFAGLLGIAIIASPKDIFGISFALGAISLAQLGAVTFAHFFYPQLVGLFWTLRDFAGLFTPIKGLNTKAKEGKLRILILNWRDTKHKWAGGAEVYIEEIAERLVKDGHEVTIFCGHDRNSKSIEVVHGVNIIRKGGFYGVYFWAIVYYILRFRGKFNFIVDCENGIPFFTPLYSRAAKVLIIHHVHSEVFRRHLKAPFAQIAYFLESKVMPYVYVNIQVITVSESSKKDIVAMNMSQREMSQLSIQV